DAAKKICGAVWHHHHGNHRDAVGRVVRQEGNDYRAVCGRGGEYCLLGCGWWVSATRESRTAAPLSCRLVPAGDFRSGRDLFSFAGAYLSHKKAQEARTHSRWFVPLVVRISWSFLPFY